MPMGGKAGPRGEGAAHSRELGGGQMPVGNAISALEFAGDGGLGFILGLGRELAGYPRVEVVEQKSGSQGKEGVSQGGGGFVAGQGVFLLGQDGAGIHSGVEEHQGYAGDGGGVEDGGGDRSGAAVAGEQGGMEVEAAVGRDG